MLHLRKGGTDWTVPGLLAVGYCTLGVCAPGNRDRYL